MTDNLKLGDYVVPKRGRGGPWVIQSFGSQPSLLGDADVKVAIFKNGQFMPVSKLRLTTTVVTDSRLLDWLAKTADGKKIYLDGYGWCGLDRESLEEAMGVTAAEWNREVKREENNDDERDQ